MHCQELNTTLTCLAKRHEAGFLSADSDAFYACDKAVAVSCLPYAAGDAAAGIAGLWHAAAAQSVSLERLPLDSTAGLGKVAGLAVLACSRVRESNRPRHCSH